MDKVSQISRRKGGVGGVYSEDNAGEENGLDWIGLDEEGGGEGCTVLQNST